MKEYQIFEMDPELERHHIGKVLFESDHMHEVCGALRKISETLNIDVCIFQPRKQYYRDYVRLRPYWYPKDKQPEVKLLRAPKSTNKFLVTVGKIYKVAGETSKCYIVDDDSGYLRVYIKKTRFRKL